MAFDIFGTNGDKSKQIQYKISNNVNRVIGMGGSDDPFLKDTLAANNIFNQEDMKWYTRFNRYGYLNA